MQIETQTKVAEVAAAHPASIRVFQKYGIDFCCGGQRPLGDVCAEKKAPFAQLAGELQDAIAAAPAPEEDWSRRPLPVLTGHIVTRYHDTLREELPRLGGMMAKVLSVHGANHPELAAVNRAWQEIHDDLGPHLMKEERVLFPYAERLAEAEGQADGLGGSPFGSVGNPIMVMEDEHEAVGRALRELRRLTGGYTAPKDACNTFRGLYHGFAELERELHEHIHLENNVLFPRAVVLEQEMLRR